jgi:aryl-alcohol dehydrogenase
VEILAAISRKGAAVPELAEATLGELRPDELRVRLVACGICHTDLHAHSGFLSPLPIVLGHEGAGVVEAVGSRVDGFAEGDHVVLSGSSCGHCRNCRQGTPSYCNEAMQRCFGGKRADGTTAITAAGEPIHSHFFGQSSFATHALVSPRTAVKVAADLPLDVLAPMGCGVITGAGTVLETFALRPGQTLVVFGVGAVGMSAVMAARLAGALRIICVDTNKERLNLALELGATDIIDATAAPAPEALVKAVRALEPEGVDFVFNTTSAAPLFDAMVEMLAMRGIGGYVTAPRSEWVAPLARMLQRGITLRGVLGGDADPQRTIPLLIRYWREGRFPIDRLITRYPFEQIDEALSDFTAGRVVKPVLLMNKQMESIHG